MDGPADMLSFLRPAGIAPALLIVAGAVVANRILAGVLRELSARFSSRRFAIEQASTLLRFAIYFAAIAVASVFVFTFSDQALLALGGTAAVAIGFALKDLAAAVLAGITILLDKPFQVGDRVTFDGQYGEVQAIGLRSVTLLTLDDSIVTIPNNKLLTDVVISANAGELDMLVQQDFWIWPTEDVTRAKQIVSEALLTSPWANLRHPWSVVVTQVKLETGFAVQLRARVYVVDVRCELDLITDVSERAMEGLQRARIGPFASSGTAGSAMSVAPKTLAA
ncbi:MAG: mechanosensitive ion channel [Deltaproteobacteria bacterium]|nr:mechanosensitive ion channel [Deltaproteobacteria bacterium]